MKCIGSPVAEIWPFAYLGGIWNRILWEREVIRGSAMAPFERAFQWHRDRWPWMTLNCYKVKFYRNFARFRTFGRQPTTAKRMEIDPYPVNLKTSGRHRLHVCKLGAFWHRADGGPLSGCSSALCRTWRRSDVVIRHRTDVIIHT